MERYLILQDGTMYAGEAFGADGEVLGEVVFDSEMVDYMNTFTDARFAGQLVARTFPLTGCYGAITADNPSAKPALSGLIVREICHEGSNFRKECETEQYLRDNGIVGIAGIDTRSLTRKLTANGVMNGIITSSAVCTDAIKQKLKNHKVADVVKRVSVKNTTVVCDKGNKKAVVWDFGSAQEAATALVARGFAVTVVPFDASAAQIAARNPDAIVLSGGPGNPSDNLSVVAQIAEWCKKKVPTLAIGLGHQLLALSQGCGIDKLKHGHRGKGQPVRDLKTEKIYSTAQNHGYSVNDKLPKNVELSMVNVNDGTVEGLTYTDIAAFSVQFVPGANGGPRATDFVYDRLMAMTAEGK